MGTNSSKLLSNNNPYIYNSSNNFNELLNNNTNNNNLNINNINTNSLNNNTPTLTPSNSSSSLDKKQKRRSKRNSSIDSKSNISLSSNELSSSTATTTTTTTVIHEKSNSQLQLQLQLQYQPHIIQPQQTQIIMNNNNGSSSNNYEKEDNFNNNNNPIDSVILDTESNITVNSQYQDFTDQSSNYSASHLSINSLQIVCEHCNHHITPRSLTNQIQQLNTSINQQQPFNTNSLSTTQQPILNFSSTQIPTPFNNDNTNNNGKLNNHHHHNHHHHNHSHNFNKLNLNTSQSNLQPLILPTLQQQQQQPSQINNLPTNQDQQQINILAASLGSTSDLFKNSLISNFLTQNNLTTNSNGGFTGAFKDSISPPVTPRYKDQSYDSKDYLTVSVSQSDQVSEVSSDGGLNSSKQSLKRFNDILSKSNQQIPLGNNNTSSSNNSNNNNNLNGSNQKEQTVLNSSTQSSTSGSNNNNKILIDDYNSKESTFLSSYDQDSLYLKDKSITSNTSSSSISSSSIHTHRSYLTTSNSNNARPRGRSISDSLFVSQNLNITAGINDLQKAMENERIKKNRYQELQALLENKEMIIDINEIKFVNKIGEGSFSEVWEGRWNNMVVAIKKLKIIGDEEQFKERFIREVQNLKNSSHQNIVMFIGACYKPACIVTEYMQGGSLYNVLHHPRQPKPLYSFPVVLKMSMDMAIGLGHLHSISIVHRDLTSQNILLDELGNVKISDFGLSRVKAREGSMTMTNGGICNPRWRPPEITKNLGHYSEKVDVYCFSLVVWELLTGEIPFADLDGSQASAQVAYAGLRPPLPENCDLEFKKLLQQCWDSEPNNRPSFSEVVSRLKDIYHNNPLGFLSANGNSNEFLASEPSTPRIQGNNNINNNNNNFNNSNVGYNNNIQLSHLNINNTSGSNSSSSSTK